jgi:hypothetical protein
VDCQPHNPLGKPVLDQETFQQLLAAAYTLQEQNDRLLVKKAKSDLLQAFSDRAVVEEVRLIPPPSPRPEAFSETELPLKAVVPMTQSDVEPLASLHDSLPHPETDNRVPVLATGELETARSKPERLILPAQHRARSASGSHHQRVRRRISQSNELFWRAARVAAMAAVLALLLGGSIDRFSPLPAGLALPPEVLQQQVPFRREKRIETVLAESGGVDSKTAVIEPTATNTGPSDPTVVADQAPETSATPASVAKTSVHPKRHSTYASEADIVAPNTVIRYDARSAAPRVRAHKKP